MKKKIEKLDFKTSTTIMWEGKKEKAELVREPDSIEVAEKVNEIIDYLNQK